MRVFVTGGSGFVGGHLIERLVREGHQVRALARSASSVATVQGFGATAAEGELGKLPDLLGVRDTGKLDVGDRIYLWKFERSQTSDLTMRKQSSPSE